MDHTNLSHALRSVLQDRPEFRQKLATALRDVSIEKRAVDHDYWLWQSLAKLSDHAPHILEIVRSEPEHLSDWHEHKINLAAEYLDAVYDSLQCGREDSAQCDLEDLEAISKMAALPLPLPAQAPLAKVKALLVLLIDAMTQGNLWTDVPGLEAVLARSNMIANQRLDPMDRQRARSAASKLGGLFVRMKIPALTIAGMYARVLLEALEKVPEDWVEALKMPLRKTAQVLLMKTPATDRAHGIQMAMRVNDLLDRVI